MSKIYGYKERDVKKLYAFLKENKERPLSETFFLFGMKNGKSKGTVRNLYYAMAKKSREDEAFRNEFLDGEVFTVKKNEKFGKDEEIRLFNEIVSLKEKGNSVRSAVNILSGGDMRLALRYQNKYRNALKAKSEKPSGAAALLKKISPDGELLKKSIPDEYLGGLKKEINGLYDRLLKNLKKENEYLKERLSAIERDYGIKNAANGYGGANFSAEKNGDFPVN